MKEINQNKIEKEISKYNNNYKYTWDKDGRKILSDENKAYITEEERKILKILLIQELPNDLHKNLWLLCSGARALQKEKKDIYPKLLKYYTKLENKNHYLYKYLTKKLSHDLHRSDIKEEEVNKLKNILNAFIIRNLSINYCQGLNLIVAYLLKNTDYKEEESFFLFIKLMEDILPFDYYYFAMGIEAEISLIRILIEKYDNELYNHLDELNSFCFLESKLSMWIISLMQFNTDIRITNFFFDLIFFFCANKNNFISYLYKMIFSIISILRSDLLNCQLAQEVNKVIENFSKNPISEENFQKIIYYNLISKDSNKFSNKFIFELRQKEIKKVAELKKLNYNFEENIEEIKCNKLFPLCVKENKEKPIEDFVVYKPNSGLSIYIIEDYFYEKGEDKEKNKNEDNKMINNNEKQNGINLENKIEEEPENKEDDDEYMNNLVIERRKHVCEIK